MIYTTSIDTEDPQIYSPVEYLEVKQFFLAKIYSSVIE